MRESRHWGLTFRFGLGCVACLLATYVWYMVPTPRERSRVAGKLYLHRSRLTLYRYRPNRAKAGGLVLIGLLHFYTHPPLPECAHGPAMSQPAC